MCCAVPDNLVKMLTAECQLERFLLENPPNEKNIDTAAVELPSVQQELLKVAAAHPKVQNGKFRFTFSHHFCQLELIPIRLAVASM